jgi:pyridoxine 5-phosphate synthase
MGATLSVNLNKVALLRNARGRNVPDLLEWADRVLEAGAHGITLHPRMDQRHVRFSDVPAMAAHLAGRGVELNVECEDHPYLIDMVVDVGPAQCTLVPVDPGEVTSSHGWDLPRLARRLGPTVARVKERGVRVSAFTDPIPEMQAHYAALGVDRVEIYTGPFAWAWTTEPTGPETEQVWRTGAAARAVGLGLNAGHDLDRHNLVGLAALPGLQEVSIGHALTVRALEVGMSAAVRELLAALGDGGAVRA